MTEKQNLNLDLDLTEEDLYKGCKYKPDELEAKMKLFLMGYLKYGVISRACALAGIKRQTFLVWKKNVDKFREVFEIIDQEYTDKLEEEANRRAMEKSDTLLQFLLRARRPEKFNPTYNVRADIETSGVKLVFSDAELSPEEKKKLEEGFDDQN